MRRVSRIRKRVATRPSDAIRWFAGLIQFHANRISAKDWRKGLAGACFVQSSKLPAAESPFWRPCSPGRTRHFPGEAENKGLGYVEVRESARSPLIKEQLIKQSIRESIVGLGC